MQGASPSSGSGKGSYQPTPKPSPLTARVASRRRRESKAWLMIEWAGRVTRWQSWMGSAPLKTVHGMVVEQIERDRQGCVSDMLDSEKRGVSVRETYQGADTWCFNSDAGKESVSQG